ncbi:MAG: protein kinase [Gemmataceae bacterium]
MAAVEAPLSACTVPGYRLERKLGEGGMGQVFLASEEATGRTVAIKFLPGTFAYPGIVDLQQRFEREVELAAQITHPRFVAILERNASRPQPYLVMEYVEGGNLRSQMVPGQPMDPQVVARWVGQIVEALRYLAEQRIVHRDLKPENILLTETGQVKVADLGLASRLSQVGAFTQAGQVLGTYDYMAPEQRCRLPLDERADQYSLAVIAYELLTGRRPVGRFRPVSQLNAQISPRVDAVLGRALQEDPDDRFDTIDAFGQAMEQGLRHQVRSRLWRPVLVGLLGAAGVVGGTVAWRIQQAPSATEPAPEAVAVVAPEVDRKRFAALIDQGIAHDAAMRRTQAVEAYTEATALDPSHPLPLVRRAHAEMMLRQYDEALADLERALKLDGQYAEAHIGRGAVFLQMQRYREALLALERGLELDPNSAMGHAHRGRAHLALRDEKSALADFNRAVELDGECGLAYFYRGRIAVKQKRHAEAASDLTRAVKLTPDNPIAHGELAQLLLSNVAGLGDAERASDHARRACELTRWARWQDIALLARAHAAAGRYEDALAMVDQALSRNPPTREERRLQDQRRVWKAKVEGSSETGP